MAKSPIFTKPAFNKTLYIIDGGKGGVGKSLVSTIACGSNRSRNLAEKLLVLDGDTTNPDVSRRFKNCGATVAEADLRHPDDG